MWKKNDRKIGKKRLVVVSALSQTLGLCAPFFNPFSIKNIFWALTHRKKNKKWEKG